MSPIFDYYCPSCSFRLEDMISLSGSSNVHTCPHCGEKMKKQVTPPALRFKGSGWQTPQHKEKENDD